VNNLWRLRNLFGTTVYFGLDRVVGMGSLIIVMALLARSRSPADFGRFSYALSNFQIAASFLAMGAEAVFVRELVRREADSAAVLSSAIIILGAAAAMSVVVWLGLSWSLQDRYEFKLALAFAGGLLFNPFQCFEALFKAKAWAARLLMLRCAVLSISLILKVALIRQGASLIAIALMNSVEVAVMALALAASARGLGFFSLSWAPPLRTLRFLARQCAPAMLSATVVALYFRFVQIVLSSRSSYVELSRYTSAFVLIQVVNFVATVLYTVAYPRLVRLHVTDVPRYERVNCFLLSICAAVGYAVITVCWIFGGHLLTLVFGARYRDAAPVLLILAVVSLLNLVGAVRSQMTFIADLPHYHSYNTAGGFFVIIPTSLLLVPRYGAEGAATALLASAFVSGVVMPLMLQKTRKLGIFQLRGLFLLDLAAWKQ
jgi:O-antigen/teichoic acid export membrane protein